MREKLRDLWKEIKKNRESYLLILPYFTLFFVFVVIPVIIAIVLSFTNYNIIQAPKFIGWSNYKRLFLEDDVFLIALQNTFKFALITGPLSYFACLLFAWLINELSPKVRSVLTLLFYAPALSSSVFFIWTYIFSGDIYGLLNGILINLGIIKEPIYWLQDSNINLYVLMVIQLWMSLGTSFLAFIAGFQTIDRSLYEAGAVDGIKNRWQELWYITLPSMKPQLIFGAIMQVTASFAVADISATLIGFPSPLYSAHTIVLHMWDYGNIRYEMGYASAIAVILFLITVLINQGVRKIIRPD
ncbi:MAG TPA: sugar ABC transporter permease [Dictyoglomaceae bacterium]|nr:sugar ABC transporter permease [Dictyoglomaceae bacterium]HOL39472.1 sugar ABC transporter permease [Dictyoglomaceae bacterium]HPP15387.1 sugar ABC transporter permease [Dictyoglomaceae bacterium]HPU43658.1 sugar ABC transporter permease [Dictyoglomaceae bacterium]